jgi:hypothetical protein
MTEQEKLEALRAVLVFAKAGWASREGNMSFPPQFGVVQSVIDDQQRYLDDPVHLAVHCMGLFAEYLPFDMLAVLVLSDKHLSDNTIAALETDLEEADGWEFVALRFFKLGKGKRGIPDRSARRRRGLGRATAGGPIRSPQVCRRQELQLGSPRP